MADELTADNTRHWTGQAQDLNGFARVDGQVFRWMGNSNWPNSHTTVDIPPPAVMQQTGLELTPTRTVFHFVNAAISLDVTFLQPSLPRELEVLSRPVTYLVWKIQSRDGRNHDVSLYLDASGNIATDNPGERVLWSRFDRKTMSLLRIGTLEQPVLVRSGDDVRINYGWFYLAAPKDEVGMTLHAGNRDDLFQFVSHGTISDDDDLNAPRPANSQAPPMPLLIATVALGSVGTTAVERHILLAYDEVFEVEYLQRRLYPLWRKYYSDAGAMVDAAEQDYARLCGESKRFDTALEEDLAKVGGPEYAALAVLAYQQVLAAHGLAEDIDGTPYMFSKENFSNGSIGTTDVLDDSMAFFLFFNPKLLQAQLTPIFQYAQLPRWKFPFAPHDLGKYPLADGQLYGGGEISDVNQMPVEESGTMILLTTALVQIEGSPEYAAHNWGMLTKWAEYLAAEGFDPANQLPEVDVSGHLAHSVNLSVKAIESLAAYAQLAQQLGRLDTAQKYRSMAEQMATKWQIMAVEGDHFKLAFDQPGTWCQIYDLVWDQLLGLHLFPDSVRELPIAFYKTKLNKYGLPLDNRADRGKLSLTIWTATTAANPADFRALISPLYQFLNDTPTRVPMVDLYDTKGKLTPHTGRAHPVSGGVYIKMLSDPATWHKWAETDHAY